MAARKKKRKAAPRKRKTTKRKSSRGKRKAFGGYAVSFKGCKDSLEKVFGTKGLAPSAMTKKLWAYIKRKSLAKR